jgi:lipopolysaccharide biosynthesis protein/predicted nuclease with TOPRIM domain
MSQDLSIPDQEAGELSPRATKNDGTIDALLAPTLDVVLWPASRAGSVSAWWGHVPFGHWLVKSARPRVIVELGTHAGVSYSAFCEAVLREGLAARCFAVDTWLGDEHAGQYSARVFDEFSAFNDARYGAFSTLLRSTFDNALQHFEDNSIDLLHIDGFHTYEAVKHDFASWLPKMSDRGIILFHDTNVREREFGVWRLWEELQQGYSGFEFLHGHGLGVLIVGSDPPEAVKGLLELGSEDSTKIRERFSELGARWTAAYSAQQMSERARDLEGTLVNSQTRVAELSSENAGLQTRVSELASENAGLQTRVAELTSENAGLQTRVAELTSENAGLQTRVSELASENAGLQTRVAELASENAGLQTRVAELTSEELLVRNTLNAVKQSTFWRATNPFRVGFERMPHSLRLTLRRGVKAMWWALTPQRLPARIAFLRARKQAPTAPEPSQLPALEPLAMEMPPSTHLGLAEGEARYRVDRMADITSQDVVVLVCYCAAGRLSQLQHHLIREYHNAGYLVALVINSGCFAFHRDPGETPAAIQIVRENLGFDFGAWQHAIRLIGGLGNARTITFANDSIVTRLGGIAEVRRQVDQTTGDVVFLTANTECRPHLQSYFFCFKDPSGASAALDFLASIPYYSNKERLIWDVELVLSERIAHFGLRVEAAYSCGEAAKSVKNPVIHNWRTMVRDGCPFLKVQLFTLGLENSSDPDVRGILGDDVASMLDEHLHERITIAEQPVTAPITPAKPALNTPALFDEYGAQQAFNPPSSRHPTLVLPFIGTAPGVVVREPKVLGIIHCFYLDVAEEILREIASLNIRMDLLLTTDTDEKRLELDHLLETLQLSGHSVVCPNRGRDVAPFIIEGKKFIADAELIFHLHTKKSPHDSRYADWGNYVRKNLIGSTEIVQSIYALFEDPRVGIVYSNHHREVVGLRNWGYDFDKANALLERLRVNVSADDLLDFPTSTMFWARKAAIEPLFHLGMEYHEFDQELGQVDGTLAHSIERSLIFLAESRSYTHVNVVAHDCSEQATGDLTRLSISDIKYHLDRHMSRILGTSGRRPAFFDVVQETYPVTASRSNVSKPRLNLLLPTAKPEKIYGGVSSAIRCAAQIIEHAPNIDLRVVITSDSVDRQSLDVLSSYFRRSCILVEPSDDVGDVSVVSMAERQMIPLAMRSEDVFLATAWWTADLGFRLLRDQRTIFGATQKLLYLIQDYEPGFYQWSARSALAEATYRHSADTIALINSEELSDFMSKRFTFAETHVLPFYLNERIMVKLRSTQKEKIVLVYGRPSVERNAFAIVREAVRQWQAHKPAENCQYQVVFAGEDFSPDLVGELENVSVAGKLSLDDYADLLNRSAIGLSLMISPHPSYPPLEMASAGCVTITNTYESKNLSRRSDRFISLEEVTPEAVANALEVAKGRVCLTGATQPATLASLDCHHPILNFNALAQTLFRRGETAMNKSAGCSD